MVGVTLTLALAVLSFVRVSPSGISYRKPEIWSNKATLVLTQDGAPELRSVLPTGSGAFTPSLADTGRFASLIDIYATLATSDAVVRELERRGLLSAKDLKRYPLPITAAAVVVHRRSCDAADDHHRLLGDGSQGDTADVGRHEGVSRCCPHPAARERDPAKDRIQLRVVNSSDAPELVDPRSKALPVLVLLGGLIATLAVAFTRDNLARRERVPVVTPWRSLDEPREPDVVVGVTPARVAPRPVPRPESAAAREDTGAMNGGGRVRSTLGSVSRPDSPTARERTHPDEAPRQARRT